MVISISETAQERTPLSRERVLDGAVAVADAGGIGALTIRSLAQELGVKPMSIDLPLPGGDWRSEMSRRAISARRVLRCHPWAIPLMQSRTAPGPATLTHLNANIATLRAAGFSVEMTAHAYALIDSYIYGFALSEASLPINGPETVAEVADSMMHLFSADAYPHLVEFSTEHVLKPGYDFGLEFKFGLDLILDGLTRWLV